MANKERRLRLWATGLSLAFLFFAYKCSSQIDRIHRYSKNPEIVTLIPKIPMKFNDGNNDTIYVSIAADSLGDGYDCRVFCFMPKNRQISQYRLEIGTRDSSCTLKPTMILEGLNYAEYDLVPEMTSIINHKITYIGFNQDTVMERCETLKTPDFFTDFFALLK